MTDANLRHLIEFYREVEHEARASRQRALSAAKRVMLLALLAVSVLIYYLLATLHHALIS